MLASVEGYIYYVPDDCKVGDLAVVPPAPWGGGYQVWRVDAINVTEPAHLAGITIKRVVDIIKTDELVKLIPKEERLAFLKAESKKLGYRLVPRKDFHAGYNKDKA